MKFSPDADGVYEFYLNMAGETPSRVRQETLIWSFAQISRKLNQLNALAQKPAGRGIFLG
jgi:hypothetical protein